MTDIRKILTKDDAETGLEALKRSCLEVSERGGVLAAGALPSLAGWGRDIIAVLGDEIAPEITQALAQGFGLSLIDAAQSLTDPEAVEAGEAEEKEAQKLEDNLPAILGKDSLIIEYLNLLSDNESSHIYHAASLITAVSGALRRRALIDFGIFKVYPNLYTILVGPSGARKDTAIDFAIDIVKEAVGKELFNPIAGEGSPQGIYDLMRAQYDAINVADILISAPEMKVMFGNDKYKLALAEWLTDWYKCQDEWVRPLRGKKLVLNNVYVCLLAGSTMDWFKELPHTLLTGGFLPRAWLVRSTSKRKWIWKPNLSLSQRAGIVGKLKAQLHNIPNIITFTPEAESYLKNWYETTLPIKHAAAVPLMKPYYERIHVIAMKLAAILAIIDDNGTIISKRSAEKAINLIHATEAGTHRIIEDVSVGSTGQTVKKVLDTLTNMGGKATKQDIVKALQLQYPQRLILEALTTLEYTASVTKVVLRAKEYYIIKPT